jgi:oxygen-independent coproporphyrinogen-3 oxidase
MELPFNTTISRDLLNQSGQFHEPVADWPTKRRWVADAFTALETAGYHVRSAYTAVRDPGTRFVYTDRLWQGADMIGLGVASFGHVNGVHMQNLDRWETYSAAIRAGELALGRAYRPTDEERLIREMVLQLKSGSIRPPYFRDKYGVDIVSRYREPLAQLHERGYLQTATADVISLTRAGLLRVDSLLPHFFRPEHRGIRYT